MTVIHGDCLEEMRKMNDCSIDFIVTDPPYGLKFMGKQWDHGIPGVEFWGEMLRICKPGSMLAAFGGSRTHHHLMIALEQAGWEIRDCICWLYGNGFPKSHNKFGLESYGTALKPAWEPIIIAMKPCEGTFAQNVQKWGVGGINIDECKIGTEQIKTCAKEKGSSFTHLGKGEGYNGCVESTHKGRWPANLILDEEAAEMLDAQSGFSKSPPIGSMGGGSNSHEIFGRYAGEKNENGYGDSGGASRFFYCAKASSQERNQGLEGMLWLDNLELVLYNGTSFTLEELWVQEGQNQSMSLDSEALQKKDMFEGLTKLQAVSECCIIWFGNNIEDLFPKTIRFTTSTGSKQTIELKTLSFYHPLSTSDCIQDVLEMNKENGINLAENVGLKNILKLIFTKEKTEFLLGAKGVVKKMSCLTSVKDVLQKGNLHCTVKPLALMRYVITLLAPPNNPTLLDPFCGSGSTLMAARELGINAIGIEKEHDYVEIARKRIESCG